jgi:uncharacterized membrane protein
MLYSWLHLIALVVYVGAVVGLWLMLLPSVAILSRDDDKAQLLARGLKFFNPLQVGALGIILFTGAFQLTELKAAYREQFVQQFGYILVLKLLFAFLLVIFSVYQGLGVGHRFVRRYESGEPVTGTELRSIIGRLKGANWCIALLTIVTVWLGIRLGH